MSQRLIYLYGFVPEDTEMPEHGLAGIADGAVTVAAVDGIGAVIGHVPAEEYGAEPLEAKLRDVPWVAEQGLRHEQVVAWFVDHATIVPVRLFTLCSSLDALADEVRPRIGEIASQLERFRAFREWDLKVAYDPERLEDHLGELSSEIAELDAEMERAKPGRRYLLERKREELARTAVAAAAHGAARDLLETLRARARETRVLKLPENGQGVSAVLSAALLVERAAEGEIRQEAEKRAAELGDLGIQVVFSGPWAPYRFARPAEADEDTAVS